MFILLMLKSNKILITKIKYKINDKVIAPLDNLSRGTINFFGVN